MPDVDVMHKLVYRLLDRSSVFAVSIRRWRRWEKIKAGVRGITVTSLEVLARARFGRPSAITAFTRQICLVLAWLGLADFYF